MPSNAWTRWRSARSVALIEFELQCWAAVHQPTPRPELDDENLRGYVMLLSAHFQGFCRDLYSECVLAVVATTPAPTQYLVQRQCETARQLDVKNPTFQTICGDFDRFGLNLSAALQALPTDPRHLTRLNLLSKWRNHAAHHNPTPPPGAGTFSLTGVNDWLVSCGGLAIDLDAVMYNHLVTATGTAPW